MADDFMKEQGAMDLNKGSRYEKQRSVIGTGVYLTTSLNGEMSDTQRRQPWESSIS